MDEEGLRSALHRQGLGRVAEDLLAMAAPMVRIYAKPAEDEAIPIGASKLGGQPDLPEGVERPAWHEPMGFLGQFNLAEVAPHDTEAALPTAGLLSFFFETDGEPLYSARWGLPDDAPYEDDPAFDPSPGWRVLYHQGDPATFVRREDPSRSERVCPLRPMCRTLRGRDHTAGRRWSRDRAARLDHGRAQCANKYRAGGEQGNLERAWLPSSWLSH